MHIDKTRTDSAALNPARLERPQENAVAPVAGVQRAPRTDRVEISAHARSLAGAPHADAPAALSAERMEEIRARIASGDYDAPEVLRHVAQRILVDPDYYAAGS